MWRRRRTALNEALHELRRPLQALVLAGSEPGAGVEDSVRLAATALERLDCEINGGRAVAEREPVRIGVLLRETVERWQPRAGLGGRSLVFREVAAEAQVEGDRWALAQALDNLVVNAIEHGGPRILASVDEDGDRVRVRIRDCGRPLPMPGMGRGARVGLRDRLAGGPRHGHGLRVVRRVAAAHGGSFALTRSPGGAEAILELPAR